MHILYIHGFLSSPQSLKARNTQSWLAQHRPEVQYACPSLSSYPREAKQQLEAYFDTLAGADCCAIGSSLGGYWASHFLERGLIRKAVVVNPAVSPQTRFHDLVGQTLKSYYSETEYRLSDADIQDLEAFEPKSLAKPADYWLMAQTGDEVLDYRDALARYEDSKHLIEEGGNHSFEGYERWISDILRFFDEKQ